MTDIEPRYIVAYFEDDQFWIEIVQSLIENDGGKLFAATTMDAALRMLSQAEELLIQLIVLDGNLGGYNYGRDAQRILNAMQEWSINIPTIGMSGDHIPNVTKDVGKGNVTGEFIPAVHELLHLDSHTDIPSGTNS